MATPERNVDYTESEYVKNYVVYHALVLYRAMLIQTPGGPQVLPNYDNLFHAIDIQLEQSSSFLDSCTVDPGA